jgi:uncharacterized membrane protein
VSVTPFPPDPDARPAADAALAAADGGLRLSVVVPAYREADRIAATIVRLREALAHVSVELIVADDGSGDGTAEEARRAGADLVVELPAHRGKGAAVRGGALAAHGRVIAFVDADLAYSPDQIMTLLRAVEAGADAAVGSRKHVDALTLLRAGRGRQVAGRLFNVATHALLLTSHRDTQCGLKAFRADVARLLFERSRIDGFAYDVELFHLMEQHALTVAEVPVTLTNAKRSSVRVLRDGATMTRDLVRIRRWSRQGVYAPCGAAARARSVDGVRVTLVALIGLWTATFFVLGLLRHASFHTFGFDVGIFDQAVWLLSDGREPFITVRGLHVFGNHANGVLVLLAPFYRLGAGPDFLLAVHIAAMAAGSAGVYLVARDRLGARWEAVALAAVLLLHPAYQWLAWEHFQPETLAIAPLVFAYWAARRDRWGWFAVAVVLALVCKENVALAVAPLGLLVAAWGHPRIGLATAAVAGLWFLVAMEVVLPGFSDAAPFFYVNYAEIGSTPWGVAREAVQHPGRIAERLAGEDNRTYLAQLFAPVAMLPVAALPTLLVAAPVLAANLLSSLPYSRQIMWHHAAVVLAGIILATIEGVRRLGRGTRARRWLIGLALANGLVATLAWGPGPQLAFGDLRSALSDARGDAKRAALARVPDDTSTSASYALVPHLTHRRDIYEFPEPWRRVNFLGVPGEGLPDPRRVVWIVVDRQTLGPESQAVLRSLLGREFAVRYQRDDVVVAERVRPRG